MGREGSFTRPERRLNIERGARGHFESSRRLTPSGAGSQHQVPHRVLAPTLSGLLQRLGLAIGSNPVITEIHAEIDPFRYEPVAVQCACPGSNCSLGCIRHLLTGTTDQSTRLHELLAEQQRMQIDVVSRLSTRLECRSTRDTRVESCGRLSGVTSPAYRGSEWVGSHLFTVQSLVSIGGRSLSTRYRSSSETYLGNFRINNSTFLPISRVGTKIIHYFFWIAFFSVFKSFSDDKRQATSYRGWGRLFNRYLFRSSSQQLPYASISCCNEGFYKI